MTTNALRGEVIALLKTIAPEVEEGDLVPGEPLRNQVDLDSMDWLNFLTALHERTGIDIPEADYRKLHTLEALLAYLENKQAKRQAPGRPSREGKSAI